MKTTPSKGKRQYDGVRFICHNKKMHGPISNGLSYQKWYIYRTVSVTNQKSQYQHRIIITQRSQHTSEEVAHYPSKVQSTSDQLKSAVFTAISTGHQRPPSFTGPPRSSQIRHPKSAVITARLQDNSVHR